MDLRVATCLEMPESDLVDPDAAPLADALSRAGFSPRLVAWDDPGADWDAPVPTVIRSTWNYTRAVERFEAWADRAAAAAPLFNPPAVVRWNTRKRYLADLAARGVPVVPTTIVERGGSADPSTMPARVVLKPEVGAGSFLAGVFDRDDPAAHAHLRALTARGAALVQPFLASVEDYGERSLVFLDGALSHAVRKSPRFAGDSERVDGPVAVADDERAAAEAAMEPFRDLLYGRVDLARDDGGRPVVMELELVEPSLFFARGPGSADRYAAALRRRLGRAS